MSTEAEDYSERHAAKLDELIAGMTIASIVAVPGVYQALADELNNAVIAALAAEDEEDPDDE